ncbi:Uncharacterised protein [uncultured archaeon]|nr:Uncharacterised protein [uncultured archaeon]
MLGSENAGRFRKSFIAWLNNISLWWWLVNKYISGSRLGCKVRGNNSNSTARKQLNSINGHLGGKYDGLF